MPKVSIIIPCYNQAEFLPETLDSVLAQTYQDWECIIINDGSLDNTEEIARNYCSRDKRFVYIFQENQGVIAARNNAISHSLGEFILPLDGDDIIAPEYVKEAVRIIDRDSNVKIVYSKVEFFGDKIGPLNLPEYSPSMLLRKNCFTNSSMYRREDFDRIGGYNPNMKDGLEDWDFWISILEKGGKTKQLDFVGFYYRIMKSHESRNKDANKKRKELLKQMFFNHAELYFNDYLMCLDELQHIRRFYDKITQSPLFPYLKAIRKIMHKLSQKQILKVK